MKPRGGVYRCSGGCFGPHNARYEATIYSVSRRWRHGWRCDHSLTLFALVRYALPKIEDHKLDTLAQFFRIPIPPRRHPALPYVQITARIFLALVGRLQSTARLNIDELRPIAGLKLQPSLF